MKTLLVFGDTLALAATTMIGFATHGETDLSFLPRYLAIYIPLMVAWLPIASWFGLFQPEIASDLKQLWRVLAVMVFVAPLAVVVRSLILHTNLVPIFILALGGTSMLGIMLWRGAYFVLNRK